MYKRQSVLKHVLVGDESAGYFSNVAGGAVVVVRLVKTVAVAEVGVLAAQLRRPLVPVSYTHLDVYKRQSMTPGERDLKDKLTPSRKERIAKGSGTSIVEVNSLLKQFDQMQKMMKQLSGGNLNKKMKRGAFGGMFGKGGFPM